MESETFSMKNICEWMVPCNNEIVNCEKCGVEYVSSRHISKHIALYMGKQASIHNRTDNAMHDALTQCIHNTDPFMFKHPFDEKCVQQMEFTFLVRSENNLTTTKLNEKNSLSVSSGYYPLETIM